MVEYLSAIDDFYNGIDGLPTVVRSRGGVDLLYGDWGDVLYGGAGNDTFALTAGSTGYGGQGEDFMTSHGEAVTMRGNQGNDTMTCNAAGTAYGQAGNDTMFANGAHGASMYGGLNDDVLIGSGDTMVGGSGHDYLEHRSLTDAFPTTGSTFTSMIGGGGQDYFAVRQTQNGIAEMVVIGDVTERDIVDLRYTTADGLSYDVLRLLDVTGDGSVSLADGEFNGAVTNRGDGGLSLHLWEDTIQVNVTHLDYVL